MRLAYALGWCSGSMVKSNAYANPNRPVFLHRNVLWAND
jgi:hypothetical protein